MTGKNRAAQAARWHQMSLDGATFAAIAAAEGDGLTRGAVIGAVMRYRARAGIVVAKPAVRRPVIRNPKAPKPEPAAFRPWATVSSYEEQVSSPRHCRHIGGDPRLGTAVYCGHARIEGSAYCAGHAALCVIPGPGKRLGGSRGP
jgi:hypothetical protein